MTSEKWSRSARRDGNLAPGSNTTSPSQRAMSPKLPRITPESGEKTKIPTNIATRQIPRSRAPRTLISGCGADPFPGQAVTAAGRSTSARNCAYAARPPSRRRAAASLAAALASSDRHHAWWIAALSRAG